MKRSENMKLTKKRPPLDENVRRGRLANRKGGNYERLVARKFQDAYGIELKRTPQSGGFAKKSTLADDFRGDVTIVDDTKVLVLHIECKDQKTWKLKEWIRQAEDDCPGSRVPVVVFHEHGTSHDYVALSLRDFLSLVPKGNVVKRREL